MFSMTPTAEYSDVFLPLPDAGQFFGILILVLAVVFIIFAVIAGDAIYVSFFAAVILAVFAVIAGFNYAHSYHQKESQIAEHMIANVKQKYHADLKLGDTPRGSVLSNLEEPKDYLLRFENGSSATYKMFFNKSSEPIVVDDSAVPTAKELNAQGSDKALSVPAQSASPTRSGDPTLPPNPSDLETTGKK